MVNFLKFCSLISPLAVSAYKQESCIPPKSDKAPNPCKVGYCVETFENSGIYTCQKIIRKWSKVVQRTEDLETINNRPLTRNSKNVVPPEFRNTHTHCAIPKEGVVYKEVPLHYQPIVEKCWHQPSGNLQEISKIRNDTVGVNKQNCKLRCPDHRMDPVFYGKRDKITNPITGKPQYINTRVFQVTCECQSSEKGPGFCGWKTTGSGIKEFAGGNLACDYTFFAVKPIWQPTAVYNDRGDEEILGNFAFNRDHKAVYSFNEENFEVKYYIIRREWDELQQKHIKIEVALDDNGQTMERDGHRNSYTYVNSRNNLQMYPTDLVIQNNAGTNENQHNKAENDKSLNIRAKIFCKTRSDQERYLAIIFPWCKNKRHALKKGRPGDCGWRIESLWPNHPDNFVSNKEKSHEFYALGFDPTAAKQGKPSKFKGVIAKKAGVGNKKAESLIGQIMKGNRYWRCEDFVEKRN